MREILFRGKRVDNGEWVLGMPCSDLRHGVDAIQAFNGGIYDIIPETVGQFTGLTDKNWKKIYEGDFLKIISSVKGEENGCCGFCKSVEREDCAVVLWDYKTGGYKLKVYHKGKYKRIAKFAIGHLFVYKAEVVGNIHDNPELLGDQK